MKLENILSLLNDNQQYDQLVNGFVGYYESHGKEDFTTDERFY